MGLLNVIDFETTGLNKGRVDYAVSMGALVADLNDDKTIECTGSLYSLINIPNPLMAGDTKFIHGISVEEIANAPTPSKYGSISNSNVNTTLNMQRHGTISLIKYFLKGYSNKRIKKYLP